MALRPTMYEPILTRGNFASLLPRPGIQGGPTRVDINSLLGAAASPPPSVQPSAPPIMAAPIPRPGALSIMEEQPPQLSVSPFFNRAAPPVAGAMASLPATAPNILAPANNPTRLNLAGGAEGFTNAGLMAADEDMAYIQQDPSGMAAERRVPIGPDETFRFTDRRTGETITSTGPEEYEAVNRAFQRAGSSAKANAVIERQNPETGTFEQYAELTPPVSQAAILAGLAAAATGAGALATLPAAGAAAGAGGVGGATAGGALGANTMAQAGLQAAGLQSLATPGITVLGNAAGAGLGSTLGAAAGAGLSGALANMPAAPAPTPTPEIVVTAPPPPPPAPLPTPAPVVAPSLLPRPENQGGPARAQLPAAPTPTPTPTPEIVVTAPPAAPAPTPAPIPTPGFVLDNGFWRSVRAPSPSAATPTPAPTPTPEPTPEIVVTRPTPVPTPPPTPTPAVNPGFVLDNGFWRSVRAPSPFAPAPAPAPAPEPEIVVTAPPAAPPPNVVTGAAPIFGAGVPAVIPEGVPTTPEEVARRQAEQEEGQIDVVAPRPTLPTGFDPGSIAPVLPNLIPSVATPTPDVSPEIVVERDRAPTSFEEPPAVIPPVVPDFTNLPQPDVSVPDSGNSLLDEIIKFYTLGSGALDLLGGALGGGGGGAAMTPYTSSLGPMPTFSRGGFTPFTGDYETYGFGPEFNFFSGQPAPTPTAPNMGILPPRANPNWGAGII